MNKKLLIFLFTVSSIFLTTGFTVQYVNSGIKYENINNQNKFRNFGYSDKLIQTASKRFLNPYYPLDSNNENIEGNNHDTIYNLPSNVGDKFISWDVASEENSSTDNENLEQANSSNNINGSSGLPPIRKKTENTQENTDTKTDQGLKSQSQQKKEIANKNNSKRTSKSISKSKSKKKSQVKSSYNKAPIVTTAQENVMTQPNYQGIRTGLYTSGKEIYSQEPIKLPPVSSLPEPARLGGTAVNLPPIAGDPMAFLPVQEAVTRVLAANFMGLSGMIFTTSADVSKSGTFKSGFHTSWFKLDRVYDRVLASGESGEVFEVPLFFNYALTDDLEFALCLPIVNYTIKSRILWTKDFRESGVGDSKLSFKYRVFDNPQHQMRGAFGVGFKFPTGSDEKGLGTGKTDFEVFTAFSKSYEKIIAHLNLGYVMTGDPNTQFYPDGLADLFYYNVGVEFHHNQNVIIMAEVNGQDWGAEGLRIDVTPALRYVPNENFALEIGFPISVTNEQRYGYNYRLIFGMSALFK